MELQSSSRISSRSPQGAPRRSPPGRCADSGGEDRISALPDDLLLQVLVRLRCARAAALTSFLSRRWRGLWRHLVELSFREIPLDAVDAALQQVVCPALSRLEIEIPEIMDAARVSALLHAAARLAPADLVIDVSGHCKDRNIPIEIPCFERATSIKLRVAELYLTLPAGSVEFSVLERLSVTGCGFDNLVELIRQCPRLRVLELDFCWILGMDVDLYQTLPARRVEFPVLETLHVAGCYIDNMNMVELISRSPRLRVLKLCDCQGLGALKVHSPTIQELVLDTAYLSDLDIMVPVLKQFNLQTIVGRNFSALFSAPMVEDLSWLCLYEQENVGIGDVWCLHRLGLWTKEGSYVLQLFIGFSDHMLVDRDLIQQIAQLPEFSVLELSLAPSGHVFGAMVLNLLGTYTAILRLKVVIRNSAETQACSPGCLCGESANWRSQTIPLLLLEEIEIGGFEGTDHEVDFLKVLFRCATLMKRMTVKLSHRLSPSNGRYKEILSIFKANPNVQCYVHPSSG